jgi:branched-chain amino acid transport system ATP-binding protein
MNNFILQTEKVTKSFGALIAVHRVSFGLLGGDIHAIIGPNGAGKTTFFNLISGYYKPDGGKISFKGENITGIAPSDICKKGIIRTFQVAAIYPMLTVFENIQISSFSNQKRTYQLWSKAKALCSDEVNEILKKVGLGEQGNIVGGKLSQGDRKRLELAIVLANKPEVIMLDEPTAGMAPDETRQIMELIQKIGLEQGLSILFTEHDMSVVFGFSKRITVLHQGSILVEGTPDEVRGNREVQKIYLGEGERHDP